MEREINVNEKTESIEKFDIERSLRSLSEESWERAGWPLVTIASKETFPQEGKEIPINFWEQIFNPKNFLFPNSMSPYNPEKHFLFILHASPNSYDSHNFKAIYTDPKTLLKNPGHMINYKTHGEPCEKRSRGNSFYPEVRFWEGFHDKLSEEKQDRFPIPARDFRRSFILKKYFNKTNGEF